jgi:hypothetical protein
MGMIWAERAVRSGKCEAQVTACRGVAALVELDFAQLIESQRDVGVIGTESLLQYRYGALCGLLGLLEITFAAIGQREVLERERGLKRIRSLGCFERSECGAAGLFCVLQTSLL